jgi:RNA polymerase sigma factor (sigma-70 family)
MLTATDYVTLVAAVAERRDREAFARLFDHFGPRVNAYLVRLGVDRAAAEEMTQDVMVTLWRKADLFDPAKSSLATWLYRVARNRRIDALRRDRLDFHDPAEYGLDIPDESIADVGTMMDVQAREGLVRTAMSGLPEEQLGLVRLAFFEGLSHSQIAERTGLPLGTVKSRLRLAFTRLRRALESDGVESAT